MAAIMICCAVLFILGFCAGIKFGEWVVESRLKEQKKIDIEADEHAKDWDRLSGRL